MFIVATGSQVDGSDPTITPTQPGLDTAHAANQPCFGCHQTLDPSRAIFQATYSYNYGQQTDSTLTGQLGNFQYRGYHHTITNIFDLFGAALANHPDGAAGLGREALLLDQLAGVRARRPRAPAHRSARFASGLSWTQLVEDLGDVAHHDERHLDPRRRGRCEGELVAVSRKYHLCTAIDSRLGLTDVCGLDLTKTVYSGIPIIAAGLPSDQYGRGAPVPVLPNQPSLFYRSGVENICADVAAMVVDPTTVIPGATVYKSIARRRR